MQITEDSTKLKRQTNKKTEITRTKQRETI